MSTENLTTALSTVDTVCNPNRTISSTVVTRRNQQVFTQQIVTSRKIVGNSLAIDNPNTATDRDLTLVPMTESSVVCSTEGAPKTIRTTTKTYRRRIIRRTAPNGEVSEEIIEEGDPICGEMLSLPSSNAQTEPNSLAIASGATESGHKMSISGSANFQAMAGFKSISDTGEEQTANFSTGPLQTTFNDKNINMITDGKDSNDGDSDKRLCTLQTSPDSVQEILSDGSTVTRKFFSSKTATVTQTSTINGETKTSSKSAFMCYTGESMLQANSTMNDMEAIFNDMTAQLKLEGFDVLNRFMLSSNSNITDHLALAGGDSGSSLLAIEGPELLEERHEPGSSKFKLKTKPLKSFIGGDAVHEHPIPVAKTLESIKKVEEQQQEEVRQKIISIKEQKSSNRLYWSSMDEVKSSGILNSMKKEEIHLQEGIFEIITSEASYNISLDILIDFYYKSDLLDPNREGSVINSVEKHHLFSNILLVKGVSLQFLKDLENRWSQTKPRILDLADIILKHAEDKEFEQQYVNYLANQSYQINALRNLLQKESFKSALQSIQSNPKCCKLSLDSFLALPMQRLTRLKLLIDVVMKLMNQSKELYSSLPSHVVTNHENALKKVKELLSKSENKKYEMEQKARLIDLSKILDFSGGCKNLAIGSKVLIKEGEVRAHLPQLYPNSLKKLSKKRQPSFYLIVLSDVVIIAKKKSLTKLLVLDYCDRELVEATINTNQLVPTHKLSRDRSNGSQLSASSSTAKDSVETPTQVAPGQTFILKFGKSESDAVTDPLVLDVTSIDIRDQWISAVMSK